MKKLMIGVAALLLATGTNLFAENRTDAKRPTAEQVARRQTDRQVEHLKLDKKQSKELYRLNLERNREMQRTRKAMRKSHAKRTEQMRSILTPEQFAQWQKMRQSHCRRMEQGERPDLCRCNGRAHRGPGEGACGPKHRHGGPKQACAERQTGCPQKQGCPAPRTDGPKRPACAE